MSADLASIRAALTDVRKAYRLLSVYQTRVLDTGRYIGARIGHQFYYTIYHVGRPPNGATNPVQSNPWSMLPMFHVSFLFLPQAALENANVIRAKDWLLEVRVIGDFACVALDGGVQTRLSGLKSPEESKTLLLLYAFQSAEDRAMSWWDLNTSLADWPEPGKVLREKEKKIISYGQCFDIAELHDRDAIDNAVERFVGDLSAKLGISVSVSP